MLPFRIAVSDPATLSSSVPAAESQRLVQLISTTADENRNSARLPAAQAVAYRLLRSRNRSEGGCQAPVAGVIPRSECT